MHSDDIANGQTHIGRAAGSRRSAALWLGWLACMAAAGCGPGGGARPAPVDGDEAPRPAAVPAGFTAFTGDETYRGPPEEVLEAEHVTEIIALLPELARVRGQNAGGMGQLNLVRFPVPGAAWAHRPSFISILASSSNIPREATELIEKHGFTADSLSQKLRGLARVYLAWRPEAYVENAGAVARGRGLALEYDRDHRRQLRQFDLLRYHDSGQNVQPFVDALTTAFEAAIDAFDQALPAQARRLRHCQHALAPASLLAYHSLHGVGREDLMKDSVFRDLGELCSKGVIAPARLRALAPAELPAGNGVALMERVLHRVETATPVTVSEAEVNALLDRARKLRAEHQAKNQAKNQGGR